MHFHFTASCTRLASDLCTARTGQSVQRPERPAVSDPGSWTTRSRPGLADWQCQFGLPPLGQGGMLSRFMTLKVDHGVIHRPCRKDV